MKSLSFVNIKNKKGLKNNIKDIYEKSNFYDFFILDVSTYYQKKRELSLKSFFFFDNYFFKILNDKKTTKNTKKNQLIVNKILVFFLKCGKKIKNFNVLTNSFCKIYKLLFNNNKFFQNYLFFKEFFFNFKLNKNLNNILNLLD